MRKTLTLIALAALVLTLATAFGPPAVLNRADTAPYHGNTDSKIFHQSSCRYYDCGNCTKEFKTRDEAIRAGYRPCKVCKP